MIEQVLNDIRWLFENRGRQRYESSRKPTVNQLEHALQTATLAEAAGADDALVTAALLHDLGHMMYLDAEDFRGVDDLHEYRSLPLLRSSQRRMRMASRAWGVRMNRAASSTENGPPCRPKLRLPSTESKPW